jgi:hypothetical protein
MARKQSKSPDPVMLGGPETAPVVEAPPSRVFDTTILRATREYIREADSARRERLDHDQRNWDAFLGKQDFSHKLPGQSQEVLPKVAVSVEQFAAFVKRALVQFGSWFSIDPGPDTPTRLSPTQAASLVKCYLGRLCDGNNKYTPFEVRLTDAIKVGLLKSRIILKVHGEHEKYRRFYAEPAAPIMDLETGTPVQQPPELKTQEATQWRLRVDLIDPKDFFDDPSGRGLYRIHRVERDIKDVIQAAEDGIYDLEAVMHISDDYTDMEMVQNRQRTANQQQPQTPGFRKRVVIDECWGTILDKDGHVVHENVVWAVANDKYIIRQPEPNPWWHQEDPFVVSALIRVPFSQLHKALYDTATSLNVALNEMFNLMIDGGMAAVWGVRQLRASELEDPNQVSDGIPSGTTLVVKDSLPHNAKVLEKVTEGEVPGDAMAVFEMLDRAFNTAALTNEIKMGALPPRQVKATEITEASQNSAVLMDSLAGDIENELIVPTLRKGWLAIMQNADDLNSDEVVGAIGQRAAVMLGEMAPAERFALYASGYRFKVQGLSATLARVRDFQKIMALMQACMSNPILMQAFWMKYSADKMLQQVFRTLNLNPENFELTEEEVAALPDKAKELPFFIAMMSQGSGAGLSAQNVGDPSTPAEISQQANPITGMKT